MAMKRTANKAPAIAKATTTEKSRANPVITSMTPGSLGLKIGVHYPDKNDMCGFLPILGWATVGNYREAGTMVLTPVIKGPANHPMLASPASVTGFVGLFPIEATVNDIKAAPGKERPV